MPINDLSFSTFMCRIEMFDSLLLQEALVLGSVGDTIGILPVPYTLLAGLEGADWWVLSTLTTRASGVCTGQGHREVNTRINQSFFIFAVFFKTDFTNKGNNILAAWLKLYSELTLQLGAKFQCADTYPCGLTVSLASRLTKHTDCVW